MMQFLHDMIIFTGGVLACLFWIVLIPALIIELFDRAVDKKTANQTSEED